MASADLERKRKRKKKKKKKKEKAFLEHQKNGTQKPAGLLTR